MYFTLSARWCKPIHFEYVQVIQILLKAKLLNCDDDENDVSANSNVSLNLGFKK